MLKHLPCIPTAQSAGQTTKVQGLAACKTLGSAFGRTSRQSTSKKKVGGAHHSSCSVIFSKSPKVLLEYVFLDARQRFGWIAR